MFSLWNEDLMLKIYIHRQHRAHIYFASQGALTRISFEHCTPRGHKYMRNKFLRGAAKCS